MLKLQAEVVMSSLLRPTVVAAARNTLVNSTLGPPPSSTEITLRTEVSKICVQVAMSAINMLHANLHSLLRIFSASAMFIILSAATVLVAASLDPELFRRDFLTGHSYIGTDLGRRTENTGGIRLPQDTRQDTTYVHAEILQLAPGSMTDAIDGLDFSDPLWNFQWEGSTPSTWSLPVSIQ